MIFQVLADTAEFAVLADTEDFPEVLADTKQFPDVMADNNSAVCLETKVGSNWQLARQQIYPHKMAIRILVYTNLSRTMLLSSFMEKRCI